MNEPARKRAIVTRLIVALMLAVALGGCAGLGGEPEIVATLPPPSEAAPGGPPAPALSAWLPDLENGARIFAQRCVDCHGESGDGLGELVLAGSVSQPLDMTDRAAVSQKSPLEYFQIITEGRIENLMPPWEQALSEGERWDLALYTFSLSYDQAALEHGERLWQERCPDCELPAAIAPVYSDVEYAAQLNRDSFGGALSMEEALALAAHLRLASLDAPADKTRRGSIRGRLVHGTAGGIVPPDTLVQLQYGDAAGGFSVEETRLAADLSFGFADIALDDSFTYIVSAVYGERLFSRRLPANALGDVQLELYDVSDDPAVLSVSRIDLVVDALQLADLGAGLHIRQRISIENSSDRIFASGRRFDDGREAVLLLPFPLGARLLSGDEQGRYIIIEDMDSIPDSLIDTRPVPPGDDHQIIVDYFLPYAGRAAIEQRFNYRLAAELSLSLRDGLRLIGGQLEASGAADGFRNYRGRLDMDQQPSLRLDIEGDPFAMPGTDQAVVYAESLPVALALAAGCVAALLAGIGLFRRRGARAGNDIERLTAEMARLDERHDQGLINHDLYHQQRRELKARLARLMQDAE